MASIYDKADIYDIFEDEKHVTAYKSHWEKLLHGKNIHSLLDISIGTGGVTLPLLDLDVELYGSDLSETMINKCNEKAKQKGYSIELKCCDFRNLECWKNKRYDCVASTGNSLPYVNNDEVLSTIEQMDALVKSGGFIYFDVRNWDRILREKNRFYVYNPYFKEGNRINVVQLWDYNSDNTITFNILYSFEKDNKIFQKEIFEERYYPISRSLLIEKLKNLGYIDIEIKCFPSCFENVDIDQVEWYCVIAKKP